MVLVGDVVVVGIAAASGCTFCGSTSASVRFGDVASGGLILCTPALLLALSAPGVVIGVLPFVPSFSRVRASRERRTGKTLTDGTGAQGSLVPPLQQATCGPLL